MGCGGSKVDDQPLVILCRERKELIKAASHHRCALAAAHLAYFQSLCDVGESIKRFVDEELVVVGSSSSLDSPVLTLPSDEGKLHKRKISSSSTSISHSVIEGEEEEEEDQHLRLSSGSELDSGSESGSDESLGHIHIESSPKVEKEERLPENFPPGYQPGYPPGFTSGYYQPGYSAGYQFPVEGWGFIGENPNQNPYPNPNQNPGMYFMKKSATQSRPVVFQPENHRVENGQLLPENGSVYSGSFPGNPNTGYFGYLEQHRSPPSPVKPPPAPPSPPSVSTWDFLNVFDTYDYNRAGAGESSGAGVGHSPVTGGVRSNSSSLDSREVREREGIPDLEEETEQIVIGQTFKHTKRKGIEKVKEHRQEKEPGNWSQGDEIHERNIKKRGDSGEGTSRSVPMVERATESSFGSKTVSSFSSSEEESEFHHVNVGEGRSSSNDLSEHETVARKSVGEVEEEYVRKKGVSFELEENNTTSFDVESSKISSLSALSVHATRDLREVVKEIKSEFEVAFSHGKGVAVLLEVSKLPYQQKSSGLKVIFSRIMYLVAPSSASPRSQPQPSIRLTSRILKISKSYNGQDVREGLTGNLSSTLEQLYAWEKKLYKEVKDEEKLRVIYEEKCRTLKKLDSLGAESSKIDTTRAAIRKLLTKLDVCIRSVDSISSRIHKLRDEELQPQLTQLIHGFVRMWRWMLKCHHKQFHAIMESRVLSLRANTGLQRDSGLKAILDLEMELREWCISFNDWVNTQKSYVESLNGWLSRCLHYEPESTEDGIAPFSPSRVGAPQVFVICKDWQEAMARISGENVSTAMQGFASSLHELWERQDEERRQRVKAEYVSHDFEKRLNDLRMERARVRARNDQLQDGGASERSVVLSESGISALDDLKVDLDSMRNKLEEERARHKETIKLVNNAASSSLQAGCGHCKQLAPEYEKAASELSSHVPPVVLAKIDASEETNREFATQYEVQGFPTIKIFRNGGKAVQDYNGPREADGIVTYLKKQSGPASFEIKSADDAAEVVGDKKVVVVGVFPKLSGSDFDSFLATAEKLRSDYDFAHTSDVNLLPRGEPVTGPLVRLFKPFDELFVDSKDFDGEALEKFIKESSVPLVTVFDKDPNNHPYVIKFFDSPNTKAMLFMNFTGEAAESLKSKYHEVATSNKGQSLSFLLGDAENSQGAFQYFGLEESQVPLIIIQTPEDKKYLKTNVEVDQIESWINDFMDGKVAPHKKSQPIPTENNEPVKVVVSESLDDMVFNSGKNVLLEFYAPWCGHCQKLAPILDEVAVSYQSDPSVVIAKLDATANDFPHDTFDVKGFPTIYFRSANGNIVVYEGDRTKEDMISFIDKNKDKTGEPMNKERAGEPKTTEEAKDEL